MSDRQSIELTDSFQDVVVKMSQGNPGACTVLCEILKANPVDGLTVLLHADDMDLRGPALWVAYKDVCKEDLDKLIAAIKTRSPELVRDVNAELGDHSVCVGGASF